MILLSITNLVRVKWLNLILCLPGARLVELVTSVSVTGILLLVWCDPVWWQMSWCEWELFLSLLTQGSEVSCMCFWDLFQPITAWQCHPV